VADYGVNIAVAVKNTQAITQLSGKIKETGLKVDQLNNFLKNFVDITGTAVVNSVGNFNKALADASKNLNNAALGTEAATKAAKDYINAQDQANAALREQKELLRSIRQTASLADRPQPAQGFSAERGQSQTRARLLALETQKKAKAAQTVFNAERNFADQLFAIEMSLSKKARDAEIDNIIEQYRIENELQDNLFKRMIKISDKKGKEFMEDLGQRKNAELAAIAEIDKARKKARGEAVRLTGQTSPIGGAVGIPGSPAALRAAERAQRLRSASSSALIGGAFPLLFGQGLGAAGGGLLGGFGGGMIGGEFGFGLSLIGTQIGSLFDQLATKASELGAALNPLTADVEAVATAAGESSTEFGELLSAYKEELGAKEALEFATNRLATVVGIDGVNALSDFNSDMVDAGNEFKKFTSIVLAGIADLINQSGILRGAANLSERSRLLISAGRSVDPEIRNLMKERQEAQNKVQPFLGEIAPDVVAGQIKTVMGIEDQIIVLQRANEAKELGLQQDELSAKLSEKQLQGLRGTRSELEARNVILKNNGDLLKDEVFNAEKLLLDEKMRADVAKITKTQEEAKVKLTKEAFSEQINQAVLDYNNELLALTNRRADAQQAADDKAARAAEKATKAAEKATKAAERAAKKAEREAEKQQRAIDRRVKAVERELERTDKAFERASNQLDEITQKHEDKMAFEREYSRLIEEGSTPAAARQAVELKKQLLELDRQYTTLLDAVDAQIIKTEASIQELKAQEGVTTEYEEQVKALDELKKKRDELEGKKGKAKGAITKDLTPETGEEKIKGEMERVQGALNDLLDPANQVIFAAQAIGDAFSESFRGLIAGSMSAQEALANLFSRTAEHFADMAAQMIAKTIQMKVLGIALNFFSPGATPFSGDGGGFGISSDSLAIGSPSSFGGGNLFAADGAYVSSPTSAVVGEGGEPEYIIPESKMRESMSRYSRGARGGSVIPENGGGGSVMDGGGGTAVAAPIDVRYTVERINSVDYVTADQFQQGMQQAANQGAKQGEQQTLKRLQMSSSTRKRLGM
jgi:colicin import membrane protein